MYQGDYSILILYTTFIMLLWIGLGFVSQPSNMVNIVVLQLFK